MLNQKDCFNCGNCQYHSDGDSYCDYEEPIFVLEDWCPTDDFKVNCKNWIPK